MGAKKYNANFKAKRKIFNAFLMFKAVMSILLLVYSISLLIPVLWGISTSFKTSGDFRLNAFGFPKEFTFQNYVQAFKLIYIDVPHGNGLTVRVRLAGMFGNSLLYAGGCALAATITTCVTAYAVARFSQFYMSKVIYTIVLVTMVMPIIGNLPSEIQMSRALGFFDRMWGIWIMKMSFLGMYFLVFHAMFKSMPLDFAEAAYLDGASEFRVMANIYMPLAKLTFFTVLLLNFITFWNDYQIPLIYIPSYPTVAYGVFVYGNSNATGNSNVPSQITGAIFMLIPVLIVFLVFHKQLIGNVSMGGIKE